MPGTKKVLIRKSANAYAQPAAKDTLGFQVILGREQEYERAKRLLNAGKHPTFIGKETVRRNAKQGGLIFAVVGGIDAAVAIIGIRNGTLLVLNVHPNYRSAGLGSAFLQFLMPNFARVLESAVPWFEKNGYASLGKLKQGRSLRTQIMVRGVLLDIAGRLQHTHGLTCPCSQCA